MGCAGQCGGPAGQLALKPAHGRNNLIYISARI